MGVAGFRSAAGRVSADGGPAACSFVPLHATTRKPMRQLLKNTFTLALALVFTAGMAFGQSNNNAQIDQTGDENSANIDQGGNSVADLRQEGVLNQIDLAQEGFGLAGQDTEIDQIGNRNEADVTSSSGNGLQGNGNELDIVQRGNLNTFETPTMQGYKNDYDVNQVGNKNYAKIETRFGAGGQVGESTISIIQKFGNNNAGNITATYGGNNHALEIKQKFGDSNVASITHELPQGASGVDGLVGRVTQLGSKNKATIDLFAETSDRAVVTQDGFDNYATVTHE